MFQGERSLVPGAGIEPARANLAHRILSPMRLPVPPSRHPKLSEIVAKPSP